MKREWASSEGRRFCAYAQGHAALCLVYRGIDYSAARDGASRYHLCESGRRSSKEQLGQAEQDLPVRVLLSF